MKHSQKWFRKGLRVSFLRRTHDVVVSVVDREFYEIGFGIFSGARAAKVFAKEVAGGKSGDGVCGRGDHDDGAALRRGSGRVRGTSLVRASIGEWQ